MSALEELEDKFPEIVELMPEQFDSHDFILKLAQRHQQLYVLALYDYASNEQPFQTVLALVAKRLKERDDLASHIDYQSSKNIFGYSSEAAVWLKV